MRLVSLRKSTGIRISSLLHRASGLLSLSRDMRYYAAVKFGCKLERFVEKGAGVPRGTVPRRGVGKETDFCNYST